MCLTNVHGCKPFKPDSLGGFRNACELCLSHNDANEASDPEVIRGSKALLHLENDALTSTAYVYI